MNILIVESKNDRCFIEALVKKLNLDNNVQVDPAICQIDDYECLDGLNERKLTTKFRDVFSDVAKRGISKIGVLLDMDNETIDNRIAFVNKALDNIVQDANISYTAIENSCQFTKIEIDLETSVEIACFFTNANGKGELETLLKAIKPTEQPSKYADCLKHWRDCVGEDKVSNKEFGKLWVDFYIRWDTCTKNDRKQAERKCAMKNFDYIMQEKGDRIFNLNHHLLDDLRKFLNLFK